MPIPTSQHPTRRPVPSPAFTALALAALAAPLSAQSGTYVDNRVNSSYQVSSEQVWQVRTDHYDCGPTAAPLSGSCGVAGLSVLAAASTGPGGVMRAITSASATGAAVSLTTTPPSDTRNRFFGVSSGTGFWDRMTFGGVTPAAIRFNYLVDGTFAIDVPGAAPNYASAFVALGFSGSQTPGVPGAWTQAFVDGIIGGGVQRRSIAHRGFFDIQLAGGSFLNFTVGINTWSNLGAGVGDAGAPIFAAGTSDFSHTARLGIQALDAQGNDVTRAAGLTYASGWTYAAVPNTSVPEPSTWALFGTGLLALGGVARRRSAGRAG